MSGWLGLSLVALMLWGVWGVLTKVATLHLPPRVVYMVGGLGHIVVVTVLLITTGLRLPWHPVGWAAALAAGFCTALGLLTFFRALSQGAAAVVVPLTALYPVVTVVLSYFFLKESLSLRQLAGIAAALAAVWLLSE